MQARKRRRKGIKSAFAFVHRAYYQDEKAEEGGQLTTIEYALRGVCVCVRACVCACVCVRVCVHVCVWRELDVFLDVPFCG